MRQVPEAGAPVELSNQPDQVIRFAPASTLRLLVSQDLTTIWSRSLCPSVPLSQSGLGLQLRLAAGPSYVNVIAKQRYGGIGLELLNIDYKIKKISLLENQDGE